MRQFNNGPASTRDAKRTEKNAVKKNPTSATRPAQTLALALWCALAAAALTGCNTPVAVSGDYSTPKGTVTGAVSATTNSVTVTGAYSTTNQTVGGTVTVGK
jgi:ferric-dicitrate binding protein FerR (iron transport regulator)